MSGKEDIHLLARTFFAGVISQEPNYLANCIKTTQKPIVSKSLPERFLGHVLVMILGYVVCKVLLTAPHPPAKKLLYRDHKQLRAV